MNSSVDHLGPRHTRRTRKQSGLSHVKKLYQIVGKIGTDQVEDYVRRKGMDLCTVERWILPNLNYE
jgi:hypothetical protein